MGDVEELLKEVKSTNDQARAAQKKYYDRKRKESEVEEGDLVLRITHTLSVAKEKVVGKFCPKFEGPFKVVRRRGNVVFLDKDGSIVSANVDQIKKYYTRAQMSLFATEDKRLVPAIGKKVQKRVRFEDEDTEGLKRVCKDTPLEKGLPKWQTPRKSQFKRKAQNGSITEKKPRFEGPSRTKEKGRNHNRPFRKGKIPRVPSKQGSVRKRNKEQPAKEEARSTSEPHDPREGTSKMPDPVSQTPEPEEGPGSPRREDPRVDRKQEQEKTPARGVPGGGQRKEQRRPQQTSTMSKGPITRLQRRMTTDSQHPTNTSLKRKATNQLGPRRTRLRQAAIQLRKSQEWTKWLNTVRTIMCTRA